MELAVTLFVLVDLLALLWPLLYSLGEAARARKCVYNLELLGRAAIAHADAHRFYPSGGWGYYWIGDPDRGFGLKQPGGWMYSILPYIDEQKLWSVGANIDLSKKLSEKRKALLGQITTPIAAFYCPSRRGAALYPYGATKTPLNMPLSSLNGGVLKSDYAISTGAGGGNGFGRGPTSYAAGDDPKHDWPDTSGMNGPSFLRSEVPPSDVTRGLSETFLIGEKYLNPEQYLLGHDTGDNEAATSGFENDTSRCVGWSSPRQDTAGFKDDLNWGSAHGEGFHMTFCDCSVRVISYDIDQQTLNRLSDRHDEERVDAADWQKWISGGPPDSAKK